MSSLISFSEIASAVEYFDLLTPEFSHRCSVRAARQGYEREDTEPFTPGTPERQQWFKLLAGSNIGMFIGFFYELDNDSLRAP